MLARLLHLDPAGRLAGLDGPLSSLHWSRRPPRAEREPRALFPGFFFGPSVILVFGGSLAPGGGVPPPGGPPAAARGRRRFAGVAGAVPVGVLLSGVRSRRAVVRRVGNAIGIGVRRRSAGFPQLGDEHIAAADLHRLERILGWEAGAGGAGHVRGARRVDGDSGAVFGAGSSEAGGRGECHGTAVASVGIELGDEDVVPALIRLEGILGWEVG